MRHTALISAAIALCSSFGCSAPEEDSRRLNRNANGGAGAGATPIAPGEPGYVEVEDTGLVVDEPPGTGAPANDDCDNELEVIYRDFDESHPDFEMEFRGDVVRRQLLEPTLGADGKPVFKSSLGCPWKAGTPLECDTWPTEIPTIRDAVSFNQWYNTTAGINHEIPGSLVLAETAAGSGIYVFETAEFFPLKPTDGFGVTPAGNHFGANFLFTTEIHLQFAYVAGQKFTFRGDDDLWIFVNDKLALDLGSMHGAEQGVIDFDTQAAALGIVPGGSYAMDIFHAERHTAESNFRIETNISCFKPGVIKGPK